MFERKLILPPPGTETFFLWGPRQTGKSTLLHRCYPDAIWLDLLKAEEFRRYMSHPELLRSELAVAGENPFVVIDEIQKVPQLLDEVHWLHENRGVHFALCGSSARKVRHGAANLLGGRALRYELGGLSASELGSPADLDLTRLLNHGYLPRIFRAGNPRRLLHAYVADYLKEEIAAEGLVRNLPVFSDFLNMAALSDCEPVNFSTIARDCGVSSPTLRQYFQILEDTLLGRWLPSYRKRPKRRVSAAPKFYFADVGVVNVLARRGVVQPGSELFGKAFENWCAHELHTYNQYRERFARLSYWRLAGGTEVDFIVNDMELALEVKSVSRVSAHHLKGLRSIINDHPLVKRRIMVCREDKLRKTDDNIEIMPAALFVESLWQGGLF
jgi:predicted AAA+ superfamily ATPase